MDNFILVQQKGLSKGDPTSRSLVRAHVARRRWQIQKGKAPFIATSNDLSVVSSSENYFVLGPIQPNSIILHTESLRQSQCRPTTKREGTNKKLELQNPIGRASDALIYAGTYLEPASYRYFEHYAAEFKLLLCNRVQPLPIMGSAVCCAQAIQMHSSALLHAICYQGAAHEAVARANFPLRQNMFRDSEYVHDSERDALYHKAKTLSYLRKSFTISKGKTAALEPLTLCVVILLSSEAIMGDDTGIESHLNGLRTLVEAYGGLKSFKQPILNLIHLVDIKVAIACRKTPLFDHQSSQDQEAGKLQYLRVKAMHKNIGMVQGPPLELVKSTLESHLCKPLLQGISNAKHLTIFVSIMTKEGQKTDASCLDAFIALEHCLVSLKHHYRLSRLEECVRLALLLYSNTALWRTPLFFNWIKVLVVDLKAALLLLDWRMTIQHNAELVLWLLFLGRYATRMESSASRSWWSIRLLEVAVEADITTFGKFSDALHNFPFAEAIYASTLEQSWAEDMCMTISKQGRDQQQILDKHPCDFY